MCAEYGSTREINDNLAAASLAGWRVAQTGTRTTGFAGFWASKAFVCYERAVLKAEDEAAVLPYIAPPKTPSPRDEDYDRR